jgi:hypothetical protein
MADDEDTQDWAADCNGEGRERVVRDGRDSGVVMMAVAVEDGSGRRQQRRRTTIAAEDNGMQDQAADYDGDGQEQVAREGGDSGMVMMAEAAEDGGSGQRWRRWTATVMAYKDRGR